jgi:hypothetical protein
VAKKARTPTPPRRPQTPRQAGPRQRSATSTAAADRRNRMILYGLGGSGLVALLVVLGVLAFTGGGGKTDTKGVAAALKSAGWTFKTYPAQPRTPHYTSLSPKDPLKYNSFPPTSGRHYYQWAIWNFYTEPVDVYQSVHNLEHGGIVIQWGNKVPQSDVDEIHAFWQDDPNAILAFPNPKLGNKIALTAWTHLAEGTKWSDAVGKKFRDAFRYKGPEKIPADSLQPGM